MKGIIFNVVEEVVTDLYDADTWDNLLAGAGVDGAYTSLGNYADEELLGIVAVAAEATGMEADELWRTVGRHALPKLAARLPSVVEVGADARSFLLSVNDIIHPEVRMLYPEAVPPVFEFTDPGDGSGSLEVLYRSARRLDALAEGLIAGCGDLFDQAIEVETLESSGAGDAPDEARFRVTIGPKRA